MATTGQAASEPDSNVTPVARGHVLVVEDDPDIREPAQVILRAAGATIG